MIKIGVKRESKLDQFKQNLESNMQSRLVVAGAFLEKEMVDKINSGLSPGLLPATVAQRKKESSVPLFDTGELFDQISFATPLTNRDTVEIGVFGSRAEIAKHHEFGAPKAGIPERSFMRSAFNENKKKIKKIMGGK